MDVILSTFKCCMSRTKSPEKHDETNLLENDRINKTNIEQIRKKKKENKLDRYEENQIKNETTISLIEEEEKKKEEPVIEMAVERVVDELDKILIDERFVRNDEKTVITFSKNGIMKFLKSFDDENLPPWTPLFDKNNLVLSYRKGVYNFHKKRAY